MQESAAESKAESKPLATQTFKIAEDQKSLVKMICHSNGTTVSKFYQKCSETLIKEYQS